MSFSDLTLFSLGALLVLAGCSGEGMTVGSGPAKPAGTSTDPSTPSPTPSSDPSTGTTTDPPATAGDLVVFTTRSTFTGDFGGLAGADDRCTTYANAAGWKGNFRAWLSDKSTDAITRVPQGGPWRVVSSEGTLGAIAFADHDAWAGYPAIPLSADEFGKSSSSGYSTIYTWTATMLGGKRLGCACASWSTTNDYDSSCGDANSGYGAYAGYRSAEHGDEGWTNYTQSSCSSKQSLICYQL